MVSAFEESASSRRRLHPGFAIGGWRNLLALSSVLAGSPFGVPRLRGPDRLKAELQARCRAERFRAWP